jgi:hypothetical protein
LFAASEPGVWYDPSDLTTMFQDTAGTTPVTTPGQTVALLLDKSKGLVLGSELVTNGDFSGGTTGWTGGSGATISVVSGGLFVEDPTSSGFANQTVTTVAGTYYKITGQFVAATASCQPAVWVGTSNLTSNLLNLSLASGYTGTFTAYFLATSTTSFLSIGYTAGPLQNVTIDNISVKELPGNHATQATAASRPTYGIVPLGGRRNLLTWTEDYSNAIWAKSNLNTSAGRITPTAVSGVHNATQDVADFTDRVLTVEAKADGYDLICLGSGIQTGPSVTLNLSSGAIARTAGAGVLSSSVVLLSDGYYRFSVVISQASRYDFGMHVTQPGGTGDPSVAWTGDGTSGVLVRNPQHETGSTATAYQRVTTQYDVTEAGVQSLSYLSFDGVDDTLNTTVDANTLLGVSGTDPGYMVVGGVRFNTASGVASAFSRSAFCGDTGGYFGMWAHTVNGGEAGLYHWYTGVNTSERPYTVGSTAVITGRRDPAVGASGTIYGSVNAVSATGTSAAALNVVASLFTIGRQFGSYMNGQLYSLIVRGLVTDAGTITSTETFVAGKTGVTL